MKECFFEIHIIIIKGEIYFFAFNEPSLEKQKLQRDCSKFKGFNIVLGATIKDTFNVNLGLEFLNGCF